MPWRGGVAAAFAARSGAVGAECGVQGGVWAVLRECAAFIVSDADAEGYCGGVGEGDVEAWVFGVVVVVFE